MLLIVDTILDLLTGLCSVIASLPFSNDCGFVATWVTEMQEARRDVESWTCRIKTAPLCSQDKECSDVGRIRFADVCYRDLVGGSDALGGDLEHEHPYEFGELVALANSKKRARDDGDDEDYEDDSDSDSDE